MPTTEWVNFYGLRVFVDGEPAPVGTRVRAYNPREVLAGEFVVTEAGTYGLMTVYRDDPETPEDEGMRPGESVSLTLDGRVATVLGPDEPIWTTNGDLTSRLMPDDAEALAEPYRRAIRQEFYPDRGLPRLNLRAARKALNDFKKASADPRAVADMMIYYVEQGVACTLEYGDINERFYVSLGSVYKEAVDLIRETGDEDMIEDFRPRLVRLVSDTRDVGWGFYDYLADVYENDYPAEW